MVQDKGADQEDPQTWIKVGRPLNPMVGLRMWTQESQLLDPLVGLRMWTEGRQPSEP